MKRPGCVRSQCHVSVVALRSVVPHMPHQLRGALMMGRTSVVARLLAVALAVAPVTSAIADGRHGGGHHPGNLIWGLADAVVATAVAVISAPIAIVAAVA